MYRVRCDYRYVNGIGIVLVYFLNGLPFVYDDISDDERNDPFIKICAEEEPSLDIEDLTKNSEYLMLEELHPLIFPVELDEISILPP